VLDIALVIASVRKHAIVQVFYGARLVTLTQLGAESLVVYASKALLSPPNRRTTHGLLEINNLPDVLAVIKPCEQKKKTLFAVFCGVVFLKNKPNIKN
jgi:hypothetical protein